MSKVLSFLTVFFVNMFEVGGQSDYDEDEDEIGAAPGARPVPDNQGELEVCTRFAISKGIVDGFMRKMFVRGKEVDISQDQVTMILINEHKDGDGKWPHEFNGKVYQFKDSGNRYWKTKLSIHRISLRDFIDDVTSSHQLYTYVLVYALNPHYPQGEKHCVYAEYFDIKRSSIECINSYGQRAVDDPHPSIQINNAGNTIYRVCCTPTEMTSGPATLSRPPAPSVVTRRPPRISSSGVTSPDRKRYSSSSDVFSTSPRYVSTDTLNSCCSQSKRSSGHIRARHSSGQSGSVPRKDSEKRLSGLLTSPHDTIPRATVPQSKSMMNLETMEDDRESTAATTNHRQHSHQEDHPDFGRRRQTLSYPCLQQYHEHIQNEVPKALQNENAFRDSKETKKKKKFGTIRKIFHIKK